MDSSLFKHEGGAGGSSRTLVSVRLSLLSRYRIWGSNHRLWGQKRGFVFSFRSTWLRRIPDESFQEIRNYASLLAVPRAALKK